LKGGGGEDVKVIAYNTLDLTFGGSAGLVAYVGYNSLMEFYLGNKFESCEEGKMLLYWLV
jgi:hypothetical protein